MSYCLDANTLMATQSDIYPPDIFQSLWTKLPDYKKNLILLQPIFDEIEPYSGNDKDLPLEQRKVKYPIREWMLEKGFESVPIDDEIEALTISLEKEYQITPRSKGVSKNDLMLIAYAKKHNFTVVTLEAKQPNKPDGRYNYKIPLVCQEQKVKCIDFIELLKDLQISI